MKIAYLIGEDLSSHPGLKYKIEGQIKEWEELGHEVYKVLHYKSVVLNPQESLQCDEDVFPEKDVKVTKLSRLLRLSKQYVFISKALKSISPDITYTRYLFPAWGLADSLRYAGKLIVEINSDDKVEYYVKNNFVGIYNQFARRFFLNKADALIFVTNELAESSSFLGFTDNREVIANGVNCKDFKFIANPRNANPQICFIGSPNQSWHGLDKLARFSEILPGSTLHIIGPSKEECLELWGGDQDNVVFHGYLAANAANELVATIDVGISTLALHRNKMEEACPLKSRQYLAQGIPIIGASLDPDILGTEEFYLQLPNMEDNIRECSEKVIEFVNFCFGNCRLRKVAKEFALNSLDRQSKEKKRVAFFSKMVGLK